MLRRLTIPVAAALLALATASSAWAGTIPVTNNADSGPGSLRQALSTAGSGDTVAVPAGTYVLTSGTLTVGAGVTVSGAGARATVVSGNHASGVFSVTGAGATIQDLEVTAGSAPNGGGITSNDGLTLHRVAVVANVAVNNGGGIEVDGSAPMLIDHSLIASNHVTSVGGTAGGIDYDSTSLGRRSSPPRSLATPPGAPRAGSTRSETICSSTATRSSATRSGAGGQGGNFRQHGVAMSIRNTILAGGIATAGGDCYLSGGSTLTSLGHNAEDTDATPDSDCQNGLRGTGDRKGLVLGLGVLQDNGGPTDSILPGPGSPLLDTGDLANCQATDQRGVPRPQGRLRRRRRRAQHARRGGAVADGIGTTTATLHASADTIGLGGSARFAYGPTSSHGAFSSTVTLPATTGAQGVTAALTGLLPHTTYHFQVLVTTADGSVAGPDQTFTTNAVAVKKKAVICRVPKLAGRSLTSAKRALKAAHCKLGRVHEPRHPKGRLVVRGQSPKAGARHKAGTKVAVTLGSPPKKRHGHKKH